MLAAVRDAHDLIRAEAPETERGRRLTDKVVAALRDAGVYRMSMSKALGGPELNVLEQVEVLEALSSADGSAGWCGMINSDGGYMTAFLDPTVAKEMYTSLDLATAAVANPTGQAVVEGDSYRVTGQWAFASGSHQAAWFFLNCLVFDKGEMRMSPSGLPDMRLMAIPAEQVEILDTWDTTGLCGTASNDVRVADVVVPSERSFSVFDDTPRDPSPLYHCRYVFFLNLSAVPLGVARAAIDEARMIAETKMTGLPPKPAKDDASAQQAIGQAEALVRSARAYVFDTLGKVWDASLAGREPSQDDWVDARLAMTYAAQASKQAVGLIYDAMGTAGVYRRSPLDRQLRDITTMSQHVLNQTKTYGAAARVLLGLPPGTLGFL